MPVQPTYPGVYVQEVPSGVRTIAGVGTSIGMFIGTAKRGPIQKPVECLNYSDFTRTFGDEPAGGKMVDYVRLFFLNGGTDCYVMRIASGASQSKIELKNEAATRTLLLTAKDYGALGENIRAYVTYNGPQPEATFNIEFFRWQVDSSGQKTKADIESWPNLSMDPGSPRYAETFLTQNSKLVDAEDVTTAPSTLPCGFSLSGRPVPDTGTFVSQWGPLLGTAATADASGRHPNRFQISINGSPNVDVDLSTIAVTTEALLVGDIKTAIETAFTNQGIPNTQVVVTFRVMGTPGSPRRLRIESDPTTGGDVFIRPGTVSGTQGDLAVPLMLGTEQGGIEVSAYASLRPAPNGITFRACDMTSLNNLALLAQNQMTQLALQGILADGNYQTVNIPLTTVITSATPADSFYKDNFTASLNGNSDGVREKLAIIANLINNYQPAATLTFKWKAEVWGSRLAIIPDITDNYVWASFAISTTTPNALPASVFLNNVQYYSVGTAGQDAGGYQGNAKKGSDGNSPQATDYDNAYLKIDKEVDLFNLMVLPPDAAVFVETLYPLASVFCKKRRAFLLMDAPTSWTGAQGASNGVKALRVGLEKDYSAIFYPRLTIEKKGKKENIGASGAIAGLCGRIDGTRGVWKAPAGTEATLNGIVGLEYKFSDSENGVMNRRAVNTLRVFPEGIVNWGARTMDGDDDFGSEYKYIPIRRLALFIEESLYRGLKWVVFEPNDEPLWAQIRLNVGAFMHDLFRQGAFQGQVPKDAYFVKCDKETTTQTDRNLGKVNIWVGFAPLKPAEFVIIYLQQMAGQVQT